MEIPETFEKLFRSSPYLDLIGPVYQCRTKEGLVIGLSVEEKHCNARQSVHGGVLSALADIALGYNAAFQTDPPTPIVTASLNIDYLGVAKRGDWIEVRTEVGKVGRRLAFANCCFSVADKTIARASAVFGVVEGQT
ncbi:MAG: esterase [Oleiphilus sp.]|nr:MAG: esterase [Oleiphilus sp.]